MFKIWAIAKTTFQELAREKVFLVAVILAIALQGMSIFLGALTIAEQKKILADFGFLAIELALLGSSFFYGSYLISKEIEKQTCLLILARPLSRADFIFGKTLGLILINTLILLILSFFLIFFLEVWISHNLILNFVTISFGLWLESIVILAFVVMMSMLVRPVIALSGGIVLYLAGQSVENMKYFAEISQDALFVQFVKIVDWISPSFYKMNWKSYYFLEKGLSQEQVLAVVSNMVGWFLLYSLVASLLFRRKDIA